MLKEELLEKIKACLSAAYHERLYGVVLYGSEVRGDATSDSDIDLLVLPDGQPLPSFIGNTIRKPSADNAPHQWCVHHIF